MKSLIYMLLIAFPILGLAQEFPEKSNKLVTDYTQTLSKSDKNRLEQKLVAYDQESSVQIAIVIIKSLEGYEISDYSFRLGEEWGIGQADSDNGALILVSMNEREMAIASGYGLEGVLTDALSKRIIENEMKPRFKKGDFAGGLSSASDAIILASRGEYEGKGNGGGGGNQGEFPPLMVILFVVMIFGLISIIKAAQVQSYAKLNNIGFWAAWMLLNSASRRHGGSWSSFSGGSGGFSGGGGFGGFGGGSFGGGGASGSW